MIHLFTATGCPTGVLVGKLVQKLKTDSHIYKRRNNTQKIQKQRIQKRKTNIYMKTNIKRIL
jgi:hypothetical protein